MSENWSEIMAIIDIWHIFNDLYYFLTPTKAENLLTSLYIYI